MSASWVNTLKGMMDRGTGDLTTVDNALRKKVITEAEKVDCYNYWYATHPTLTEGFGLAASGRDVTAYWTSPTTGDLALTWNDGTQSKKVTVPASDTSKAFPASTWDAAATSVVITAQALRPDTGELQRGLSASVIFPPPAQPEAAVEEAPTEPAEEAEEDDAETPAPTTTTRSRKSS